MCTETTGYTFYWRIENFIFRNSNPKLYLRSPDFQADCLNSSHWYMIIKQTHPEFIGLNLFRKSKMLPMKVCVSISLLKSTGWETILDKYLFEFKTGVGVSLDELVSWLNIANDEWTYLPSGNLTVCLHMYNDYLAEKTAQWVIISRMTSGNMDLKHLPIQKFKDVCPSDLLDFLAAYKLKTAETPRVAKTTGIGAFNVSDDLAKLFEKMDLSFINLRTKNKEFSVLKAVLSAKSSVFKAMFEGGMRESYSNIVDIEDIDSDTMSLLIEYLHCQTTFSNLEWSEAMKLYYAADKYQIEDLQKSCLQLLRNTMSNENVCDAFVFADMHGDKELLQSAQEFFTRNSKIVLKSEEWRNFLLNHTKLASEILCKLADKL